MTLKQYLKDKNIPARLVWQEMGTSRQSIEQYGRDGHKMTIKSYKKVATALTNIGYPTSVKDLICAIENI